MQKTTSILVAAASLTAACSSSTLIETRPSGARLYLDGEPVGRTPYMMSDTKIVGSTTTMRFEYPGFDTMHVAIQRNEEFSLGACIGGVFVLVPFLWIMGYKPTHTYELRPSPGGSSGWDQPPPGVVPPSTWEAPPPGAPPPPPPPR